MKDIFIDANIANKFAAPPDEFYKDLIKWLFNNDKENPENNAILMISDKILHEYIGGNNGCNKPMSILVIINKIIAEKRFTKLTTEDLRTFVQKQISSKKSIRRDLRSGNKDWWHFPLIFNSHRKLAIVGDINFAYDIVNFPRLSKGVVVHGTPKGCEYR